MKQKKITKLEGQNSRLDIYAEIESQVNKIAAQVKRLYPEFGINTYEERLREFEKLRKLYLDTMENSETTLSQTQALAYQEIGIAIVATSLIVLFTMLYTVRERTHEIGVLKAIGFSNGSIMSQLMLEGIFMSLIAGVIGIVIGSLGAPLLASLLLPVNSGGGGSLTSDVAVSGSSHHSLIATTIDPQLMLLAFGLALVLGALGTLYPAWRASRTSPMEALKYE